MSSVQQIDYVSLSDYLREPENEYCYAAVRDRLCVAISLAQIEGHTETRIALIELLRELEACRIQSAHAVQFV